MTCTCHTMAERGVCDACCLAHEPFLAHWPAPKLIQFWPGPMTHRGHMVVFPGFPEDRDIIWPGPVRPSAPRAPESA